MKVGFIGIGNMGGPAAGRVLDAGYDLTISDIRKEAGEALLQKGARWAPDARALAAACDTVFSFLPTPADVEEVALGAGGLIHGWKAGDIYVDMSTNSPGTIRRIAEVAAGKGVHVLDAPVTGGVVGARAGTLTIMVGGSPDVLEKVRGPLSAMGKAVLHVGDIGSGNVTKLVNNMVSICCNAACAEGLVVGVKAGIDVEKLYQVLSSGTANNWNLQQYPATVFKDDFRPGFELDLAYKDMQLALQLSSECGVPTHLAAAAWQGLLAARAAGLGKKSIQAVILELERSAGVRVRRPE